MIMETYEDRIRCAYRHLTTQPGQLVGLGDLRPQVGGNRELVDAALRSLARQPGANLIPESNQKTLSDWDRECAIHHGGQDKHLIAIS
jgi:hypothetical protein